MSEKALTSSEANALEGTTDTATGAPFPDSDADPWLAARNALDAHLLAVGLRGNDFRVYEVEDNADAVGIRAGRYLFGSAALVYAGADPAVDDLTDNDTTYIWLYNDGGTATIGSAVDGTGWPAVPHVKLAEVTLASGVITGIVDRRAEGLSDILLPVYTNAARPAAGYGGRLIFNSDDGQMNVDDGTDWTLPDGTTT